MHIQAQGCVEERGLNPGEGDELSKGMDTEKFLEKRAAPKRLGWVTQDHEPLTPGKWGD